MDSCSKISQYLLYSIDYDKIGGKPTQQPQGVTGLQKQRAYRTIDEIPRTWRSVAIQLYYGVKLYLCGLIEKHTVRVFYSIEK